MDGPYVMTPREVAYGYVLGYDAPLAAAKDPSAEPRDVLEAVVLRSLLRAPCGVPFSGGRDSSLVLAVATSVARREGLPDPIPVTRVFPGVEESQEDEWQELVIRHLGLADWQRLNFADELDVVGPIATRLLRTSGVTWPASRASDVPVVEAMAGGSIIDGEGGDEVLDVAAHRIAPVTRLVRNPRPFSRPRVRRAIGALAPKTLRRRYPGRRWDTQTFTWLRPQAWDDLKSAVVRAEADAPLSFAASVRLVPTRRTQVLAAQGRRWLASQHDVDFSSPLLDGEFVHALARDGGRLGRGERTDTLRSLAADLLPDAVLARTTKATFTRSYMARHTREFASTWNGEGVDPDLVDPAELRRLWLSHVPPAPSSSLLQAAWLATIGGHS